MRRQIMVPLDGSQPAESALPHAVALARATGSELTLLHVVSIPEATNPLAWGVGAVSTASAVREDVLERAHEYLRDVTRRLGSVGSDGVAVHAEVLEGDAAEAIVVYAEQHPEVVMIVMTTRC